MYDFRGIKYHSTNEGYSYNHEIKATLGPQQFQVLCAMLANRQPSGDPVEDLKGFVRQHALTDTEGNTAVFLIQLLYKAFGMRAQQPPEAIAVGADGNQERAWYRQVDNEMLAYFEELFFELPDRVTRNALASHLQGYSPVPIFQERTFTACLPAKLWIVEFVADRFEFVRWSDEEKTAPTDYDRARLQFLVRADKRFVIYDTPDPISVVLKKKLTRFGCYSSAEELATLEKWLAEPSLPPHFRDLIIHALAKARAGQEEESGRQHKRDRTAELAAKLEQRYATKTP